MVYYYKLKKFDYHATPSKGKETDGFQNILITSLPTVSDHSCSKYFYTFLS